MARLWRNSRAQVPRLIRWKNGLKLGEVLEVVEVGGRKEESRKSCVLQDSCVVPVTGRSIVTC
ncbi:MAG: hypothetical protein OEY31_02925 [Candidatus Bathyarchaeota archaeon]|nr:hypothetical protein [Candidatus Bathyarchaeota archaeon]